MQGEDNWEEVEKYKDTISEEVEDGGGCTEAWQAMNSVRNDQTPSRRAVIKLLGSGVAATGIGAISGSATAERSDIDQSDSFPHRELSGAEARRFVELAIDSQEFEDLRRKLRVEEGHSPDVSQPSVVEIEDEEGDPHQIVSFDLESKSNGSDDENAVSKNLAAELFDGEIVDMGALIAVYQDSGPEDGMVSANSEAEQISLRIYNSAGDVVEQITEQVVIDVQEGTQLPNAAPASLSPDCFGCQSIGTAICAMGCGLGGYAICLAAGIPTGGSGMVACLAIVSGFCAIITAGGEVYTGASCGTDVGIEATCYYAGFCDDNPLD